MLGFDIIIIGGGHAGCEAALAAARLGCSTALITGKKNMIAHMSCNPSIGGLGKGHLVKEIDALGGEMARNIDATGIQFRKLNTSKGPAVQGTRAQADIMLYKNRMQSVFTQTPGLTVIEDLVARLQTHQEQITGVLLESGVELSAKAVVVTTGTFLRGLCHVGMDKSPGGRMGDVVASHLTDSLTDLGFKILRLKTGTPARLAKRSINFNLLEEQLSDSPLPFFSFSRPLDHQKQVSCHITHTNKKTHETIAAHLGESPLFCGVIKGVGPRYCPSIEDKVFRFPDRERHQIFLEPMGLETDEIYPAGLSTSLPESVQIKFLRSINGLEDVKIVRPGYAVEYDAIDVVQLNLTLAAKHIRGLYFAGQINGTSGYEEAAAQGLVAGINAARFAMEHDEVVFSRLDSYIGVMIDDLVTKGVGGEPYRMFTSRAENRLFLREDNADARLTPLGRKLGLIDDGRFNDFELRQNTLSRLISASEFTRLPSSTSTLAHFVRQPATQAHEVYEVLKSSFTDLSADLLSQVSLPYYAHIKYAGYINRQRQWLSDQSRLEDFILGQDFDYSAVPGLSTEVRQRLAKVVPANLAQASRIPGITPSAIEHLVIYLKSNSIAF